MPSEALMLQVARRIYLLKSHFVTSKRPATESAAVNITIMRTFVRLREMLLSNADLARKLDALEKKYDAQFKVAFDAIRELMTPPESPRRQIGFHSHE
jgi:hypothetical protein